MKLLNAESTLWGRAPGNFKHLQSLDSGWTLSEAGSDSRIPAVVPGCVHADLLRNGVIPDPFFGTAESEVQWVEERDWHYRCEFFLDEAILGHQKVDLVVDGADTSAEFLLNGCLIGISENMFAGWRIPAGDCLKPGKNILEVRFFSPGRIVRARCQAEGVPPASCDPVGGASYMRKQQSSFGWDWAPRLATSGLYRPVRLEAWSGNRFEKVRIRQRHRAGRVVLDVQAPGVLPSGEVRGTVLLDAEPVAEIRRGAAEIRNPRLWWPNGHGGQPLYTVKLELLHNGVPVDTWTGRIGLRTIRLDRRRDRSGESFRFIVNGRPIFAKGASWIPAHSFVSEVSSAEYDDLLTSAAEAHMNMIRVWGGGIYEADVFYELCDEKGLMVWQDFMFACSLYPSDHEFLRSVRGEAEYQVKRLANHACLALWCGNNELEQMSGEILKCPKRRAGYEEIFYGLLPRAVETFDGDTSYWPSSPHNPEGYERGHNSEAGGDAHFWDVWHLRKPVSAYEEKRFRFCSEFGMQSFPSAGLVSRFSKDREPNIFGPVMEAHQKNPGGNQTMLDYIFRRHRFPGSYAELAYLSQLNQAHCLKVGVEHFRRSMPRTMGALYWQLNDCWPATSWSSIEFGGKWKALHHEARRFFAAALLSVRRIGDERIHLDNSVRNTAEGVEIHTVYDGPENLIRGRVSWSLHRLDGRTLASGRKAVVLVRGKSLRNFSIDLSRILKSEGVRNVYFRAVLEKGGAVLSRQTLFFTEPRFIDFPVAPIAGLLRRAGPGRFDLTLQSKAFHHAACFDFRGVSHRDEDNFFDLFPGEPRTLRIAVGKAYSVSELRSRLEIRSLRWCSPEGS